MELFVGLRDLTTTKHGQSFCRGFRQGAAVIGVGQDGVDALLFNGSNANENIDIFPAGTSGHVLFSRDVGNVTTDIRGVEGIIFNALGGADNIAIEDVSGTTGA
jgi:hypothetical protein